MSRLRDLRERNGLSRAELAVLLGVRYKDVWRWERHPASMKREKIYKVIHQLQQDMGWELTEDDFTACQQQKTS